MIWGNAIGVYLLAGVVLNGLGQLVRARWVAAGKMKPLNLAPNRQWILWVGIGLAVLAWPIFLITISIGWRMRRKTRKMEAFLGYCEHSTAIDPICGPCQREIDAQKGASLDLRGRRPLISKVAEEKTKAFLVDRARRLEGLKRGAPDALGVPVFLDPPVAGSESLYRCSSCGLMSEGPAPSSNSKGWPLCVTCKIEDLKEQKNG